MNFHTFTVENTVTLFRSSECDPQTSCNIILTREVAELLLPFYDYTGLGQVVKFRMSRAFG